MAASTNAGYSRRFWLQNADGTPRVLSPSDVLKMQLKATLASDVAATFITTDGSLVLDQPSAGGFMLEAPYSVMKTLTQPKYIFDILLDTDPTNPVRLGRGIFPVLQGVTAP